MLSTVANSAVKIKTQVKNLKQTQADLSTERSHKLGSVPKYVYILANFH